MTKDDMSRADWHKSSYSSQDGNCVEVATNLPGIVAVRDSKAPAGPRLVLTTDEWQAFINGVHRGEFEFD
jgi:predicted secreted Zn-dependent protease